MPILSLLFGATVGMSLGLTGGGGAIFAVPLLVYGLSIDPRQAVGISLAAVGTTSLVGFFDRWRAGQVETATGLMFAVSGMIGAPMGSWLSTQIAETLLLTLFTLLMIVVAARMWHQAGNMKYQSHGFNEDVDGPTCRRDTAGRLLLNTPCAMLLGLVGVATGIMSGLFGVGGGFVIVPALVMFSGMAMHRAVGTSLLAITLISAAGVASHLVAGRDIPLDTTLYFVVGGVLGMFIGIRITRYLSSSALQKAFAVAIVAVGIFIVFRTTSALS